MNQIFAFGAWVLGFTAVTLMILGCILSSHPLMGAAWIVGVVFTAILMLALMGHFEKAER